MRCPRPSAAAATRAAAPSSVSPTTSSASMTRKAPRRACRLGHAGGADLSPRGARVPGGPRLRRRARRPARGAAVLRGRLRLRQCQGPGYEADDFLAAAVAREERRGAAVVATGDRDAFQLASDGRRSCSRWAGEVARIGPAEVRARYGGPGRRCRTSSRCAGMPPTASRAPSASDPRAQPASCASTARSRMPLRRGTSWRRPRLRLYRSIATMDRAAPLPPLRGQKPTWSKAAALARDWQLNKLAERLEAWRRRNRDPTSRAVPKMLTAQPARPLGTAPR